jgi:hypothetical protein
MLAIVLCMWATDLAAQWMDEGRPTAGHGAAIGVVVSAAILVKATALYIVFAVPVYAWLAGGRKTIKFSVVFGLTAALLAGWWFARNVILYGDLSAQKALTLYHYGNNPPPTPLWQLGPLKKWLWGIETYYWLPTEYHRNLYSAPLWARSIVGVITLAGIGGWLARPKTPASNASHRAKWFRWFLAFQYLACFGLYAYTCMRITDFAARCTFPTYVVYATFICVGGIYLLGRALGPPRALSVYAIVLTLALVSLNGFVLLQACRDYAMPYDIPLSAAR